MATPEDWDKTDLHGPLAPLDLEICKAVAVTVFGGSKEWKSVLDPQVFQTEIEAEEALHRGAVDLVVGVTPNATDMWHLAIAFGPAVFYDGQAVMVRPDLKADSLADLSERFVCVITGTDNEATLMAKAAARGIKLHEFDFQEEGEMDDAAANRRCDAITAYASHLADVKRVYAASFGRDPVLPEWLSLAPITPAYRQGDPQWSMLVDWTIYALIQAEASGVTQGNVGRQRSSEDPTVQRLLGGDWAVSRALGIASKDWAAQVIAAVGNYGEIYDRTVGKDSTLKLPRGRNALWTDGGLMAPRAVQ